MPYCEVIHPPASAKGNPSVSDERVKLYYRTYGRGETHVVLIMGFAAAHDAWRPQLLDLAGTDEPNEKDDEDGDNYVLDKEQGEEEVNGDRCGRQEGEVSVAEGDEGHSKENVAECTIGSARQNGKSRVSGAGGVRCVLVFDNRGVGLSSVPKKKKSYTTSSMAADALALMDHLSWTQAHIVGHSMGGMIASKLAALAPNRVQSLALVSVTGGGYDILPSMGRRTLSIIIRFARADTPEKRAHVDLDTHYSREHLDEMEECGNKRRDILFEKYVRSLASGMQSTHGVDGHFHACWTHGISREDARTIISGGFLVSVIHGQSDIIANIRAAQRVARKLKPKARMVELRGGHMITMEKPKEVNAALLELISAAQADMAPSHWTSACSLGDSEAVGETCYPICHLSPTQDLSLLTLLRLLATCHLPCGPLTWPHLDLHNPSAIPPHAVMTHHPSIPHITDPPCLRGREGLGKGLVSSCYWSLTSVGRSCYLNLSSCYGPRLKVGREGGEEHQDLLHTAHQGVIWTSASQRSLERAEMNAP